MPLRSSSGTWLVAIVAGAVLIYGLVLGELWATTHLAESPVALTAPTELQLPDTLLEADATLGYRFRPNASAFFESRYGEFGVLYEINGVGLREPGMILPGRQPPHVLFLGDEFTEGWGVMREESFQQLAQRRLRKHTGMDPYVRLLNGGVSGYGAAQSYLLGKRLFDTIGVDVVVFVFSALMPVADYHFLGNAALDENGLALAAAAADDDAADSTLRPSDRIAGSSLLGLTAAWLSARLAGSSIIAGDPQSDRFAAARGEVGDATSLYERSFEHIAALARHARARGIDFVLLHLPLPHQVDAGEWMAGREAYGLLAQTYATTDETAVAALCEREKVDCILAGEHLRGLAAATARPVYFRHDYTLTKVGHVALAELVEAALSARLQELSAERRAAARAWVEHTRVLRERAAMGSDAPQLAP